MNLYIDPSYKVFNQNKLFDSNDPQLNRDGTLLPFINLKSYLENKNIHVSTFDFFSNNSEPGIYWSFGFLSNTILSSKNPKLTIDAFFISEPPLVAPHLYEQLPKLTKHFKRVFIHNTTGDGYALDGVDLSKLRKHYWPQPFADVAEPFWSNTNRKNSILMINGQHKPRYGYSNTELYSKRITAMVKISKHMDFDLYGKGWDRFFTRNILWWPLLRHFGKIQSLYKGAVNSKLETMSQYDFALCFENMIMDGYITEKIFDCFYSGTIPIYWGPKNIESLIPKSCYIQYCDYRNEKDLVNYLQGLTSTQKQDYKKNARAFLLSSEGQKYTKSLELEWDSN